MDEKPFTGKYWNNEEKGIYTCALCGNELFSSKAKFDSGAGWPSFLKPIDSEKIAIKDGVKVACRQCGSHLGELVGDRDKHYRVNSMALDFEELEESALMANLKDELKGKVEDKLKEENDKNKDPASQNPAPAWSLKNVLVLLGAVALGAGLGAGIGNVYGALMCQIGSGQAPVPVLAAPVVAAPVAGAPPANTPPKTPVKPSGSGTSVVPPKPTSTQTTGVGATTTTPAMPLPTSTPAATTTSSGAV